MARAIDKQTMLDLIIEAKRMGPETGSFSEWLAEYLVDHLPTITTPNEWVSVEDRLPEDSECWGTYIVTVNRSHWPTSSYGICDAPYDEQLVASAQYDSKQKIWHLPWDEQLNALIQADDAPLNGDFVTHWMPPPESPKGGIKNENE